MIAINLENTISILIIGMIAFTAYAFIAPKIGLPAIPA